MADPNERQLNILYINKNDHAGGATRNARLLQHALKQSGHPTCMAVEFKGTKDNDVFTFNNDEYRTWWAKSWLTLSQLLRKTLPKNRIIEKLTECIRWVGEPFRYLRYKRGIEDFDYPGTWHIVHNAPFKPNLVHAHNLHSSYFDLRALPWLSQQAPLVLTLHDAWVMSGHCAHSLDCEKWLKGCGECPYLDIDPPIARDATAYNLRRKQEIYQQCRLFLITPSRWLMEKAKCSILSPAIIDSHVIPYGIDLSIFKPGNKESARDKLNIPQHKFVILFVAHALKRNIWKDYATLQNAMQIIAERHAEEVYLINLGEGGETVRYGSAEIRFVPFIESPQEVALYYQAADVYLHSAKADTFPNTVLEAMACGLPVIGTHVGGIPEQIREGENGFLFPLGDAQAMSECVERLIGNHELHESMSQASQRIAQEEYNLPLMIERHVYFYNSALEIWESFKSKNS